MRCTLRVPRLAMAMLLAAACRPAPEGPPVAAFLVAAGDSTFWVEAGPSGIVTRRSALLLARLDGRFHEVYIADEDLSYREALMVGQRLYRRDLRTSDSVLVRYDSTIVDIALGWAARHPGDVPLGADEETSDDPVVQATTDTELLDVVGPFLSYEFHVDVDAHGERDQHVTRRGVVDLRTGRPVALRDLLGAGGGEQVLATARGRLAAALDSVHRARDERASRARTALAGFVFDSSSFELVSTESGPAVAFLVPGQGPRAGGYSLPLGEIPVPAGSWWHEVAPTLPTRTKGAEATWADSTYDVVATVAPNGEQAALALQHLGRRWPLGSLPLPVRRVFRLGTTAADSAGRRAIARAFDEAENYGGVTQPTAWTPWNPRPRETAKPSSPTS